MWQFERMAFKIQIPNHANYIHPELKGLSFDSEKAAIDMLTLFFTEKGVDFKIKRTRDRVFFYNAQVGELASVVFLKSDKQ
jgi:hypothetical protein